MNAMFCAHVARALTQDRHTKPPRPPRRRPSKRAWIFVLVVIVLGVAALTPYAAPPRAHAASSAADNLYWVNQFDGKIGRAYLGGGIETDFITGIDHPQRIAVDDRFVYWTDYYAHAIGRASLDGTAVDYLFITGVNGPEGIAVDGRHVYWSSYNDGAIGRAELDGTGVDPAFITGLGNPRALALDSRHIYWADDSVVSTNYGIGRAKLDGTGVDPTFVRSSGRVRGVAVDTNHLYWTETTASAIARANLNGTAIQRRFITGLDEPSGLAVNAEHLYWSDAATLKIGRADLDGTGAIPDFITGVAGVFGIALDVSRAHASPSVSEIHLGKQAVQTIGAARGIAITNTGTADLHVTGVRVTGLQPDDYVVSTDSCSGEQLAPGAGCDVGVRFAPSDTGPSSATLVVESDDWRGPVEVPLTGTGVEFAAGPAGATGPAGPAGAAGTPGRDARVSCSTRKRRHGRVRVTCAVTLVSAAENSRVPWRLVHADRTYAKGTAAARGGRATVRLPRDLDPGRYVLRVGGGGGSAVSVVINRGGAR